MQAKHPEIRVNDLLIRVKTPNGQVKYPLMPCRISSLLRASMVSSMPSKNGLPGADSFFDALDELFPQRGPAEVVNP
ncbi:MAG TPA: hypothetical protein VI757_03465 [Bacteroidia bacterium]|nr:hypothetical protein [Bacteroidia bacterium]